MFLHFVHLSRHPQPVRSFLQHLEMVDNKETLISEYTEKLKKQINPRNLKKYVQSYMK